jgi:ATP-dependent RNA helicase DHX37/DHR1
MREPRQRHNAKARQSSAGPSRKKGKRTAAVSEAFHEEPDSNAEVFISKSKEQKDAERRERLQQELVGSIRPGCLFVTKRQTAR